MSDRRIALVHDFLCGIGGSERVFECLCKEFLEADVFTLAFNESETLPYFRDRGVGTSVLNRFVRSHRSLKLAFLPGTLAMRALDLSAYDLVLTSSATLAKYVRPSGIHVGYLYYPTRAIWDADAYFGDGIRAKVMKLMMKGLRGYDRAAARRLDRVVTLSETSRTRIRECYGLDADVVPSPVDLSAFQPRAEKGDFFLLVSRLDRWKEVGHAIEAFRGVSDHLVVVGAGPEERTLRDMASQNVEFVGRVTDERLADLYGRARAVVFTPYLEYGLVPIEANASGTPAICRDSPGVRETMLPVTADRPSSRATSLFYEGPSPINLRRAVERLKTLHFDSAFMRSHAEGFGEAEFRRQMRAIVETALLTTLPC